MAYPERVEVPGGVLERWDARRHRPALDTMRDEPRVTRFLDFLLKEDLDEVAARYAQHWDEYGFGLWCVVLDERGPVGWVGAIHPRWHPEFKHRVELAWGMSPLAWGRGIATRGGHAAASGCFDALGLAEVMAFFEAENTPSIAVGARLGMYPTGETTSPDGVRLLTYGLTPAELRAPR